MKAKIVGLKKLLGNDYLKEARDAFSRANQPGDMIGFDALTWLGHLNDLEGQKT